MNPYDELPSWCQLLDPWIGQARGTLARAERLTPTRPRVEQIIGGDAVGCRDWPASVRPGDSGLSRVAGR
jgi:hypothetical protein